MKCKLRPLPMWVLVLIFLVNAFFALDSLLIYGTPIDIWDLINAFSAGMMAALIINRVAVLS